VDDIFARPLVNIAVNHLLVVAVIEREAAPRLLLAGLLASRLQLWLLREDKSIVSWNEWDRLLQHNGLLV